MEEQEDKQLPQRISLAHVEQVNSDFIMALAMQQQEHERAYTMLETIESDSDEDERSDSNSNNGLGDTNDSLQSQELRSQWDFLTDDEETTDENEDMDEDEEEDIEDFDLDELSYEELIALGEFIGEEKRGLPMNEIPSCLHPSKYRTIKNRSGIDRCVICQVEYEDGEELASLLCEHPYHSECVSKWLQIKRVCPICGTEVSSPKASKNS